MAGLLRETSNTFATEHGSADRHSRAGQRGLRQPPPGRRFGLLTHPGGGITAHIPGTTLLVRAGATHISPGNVIDPETGERAPQVDRPDAHDRPAPVTAGRPVDRVVPAAAADDPVDQRFDTSPLLPESNR
ncbi:hypothetical protein [Acrocarpospora macrocephala]|uniref:hypothetical protein n=1 Tax=Acrocarpospora macrocephala TaxID=150177 RepID=UPI0012D2A616|nr:hypothetical protein [Acrocarpospora macrocephala]